MGADVRWSQHSGLTGGDPLSRLAEARAYVDRIAFDLRDRGLAAWGLTGVGDPAATLAPLAHAVGARAIVLTAPRRAGAARLLKGCVPTSTLQLAAVPLLLVPRRAGRAEGPDSAVAARP
jgi:nucleotide-binding universal stress UspA family protein